MLRTRILTALVLAPSVLAAIYYLPALGYGVLFLLITAAACIEWGQLCGLGDPARPFLSLLPYLLGYLCFGAAVLLVPELQRSVMGAALLLWVLLGWRVLRFDPEQARARVYRADALAGYLIIGAAFAALLQLRSTGGAPLVFLALLIVWLADIGAYFAGRALGRRKLAPRVSPGKTWEGAIGGMVLATAAISGILWYTSAFDLRWLPLLLLVVCVSIVGDLFESTLKRRAGVKDSGRLLPGHGGLLDRIDALLPALPLLAMVLGLVGQ
ncbi:MAG: phosphatidate cytidylyltransferase [Pseudomonadota bacterium]